MDELGIEELTGPATRALRALPPGDAIRSATAEMIVLRRP